MKSLGYAFEEALRSLRRSGRSAAMSIGTIAIAFLTLGGFLLVSVNLRAIVEQWAAAAEMSVYLRDEVDEAARAALMAELTSHQAVAGVELVSKDEALARFTRDFPELADVTTTSGNPFPASVEVRLRTDAASAGAAEGLAGVLAERAEVADVQYDRQWMSRLLAVVSTVQLAGLTIAGVLILGAAFTVAAVVRLSLQARHDELDIMELVGAPFAFIRGPSIAEGALLGGIGAVVALLALWLIYLTAHAQAAAAISEWGRVAPTRFLSALETLGVLAVALAVGAISGLIAARSAR